jgi:hypothetical protein
MKTAQITVRIALGIFMTFFGINGFLQFLPFPEMADPAQHFMEALNNTGYVFPVISIVELAAGILLLTNKFVPLSLVILFPVLFNALLFHLFLDILGIGAAAMAIGMTIFLMFSYKRDYSKLLIP